jgi:hypothetical protein
MALAWLFKKLLQAWESLGPRHLLTMYLRTVEQAWRMPNFTLTILGSYHDFARGPSCDIIGFNEFGTGYGVPEFASAVERGSVCRFGALPGGLMPRRRLCTGGSR